MRKFFCYFNTLTGNHEISDVNRWYPGLGQIKMQADSSVMPEIEDLIKEAHQTLTNIDYLYKEAKKSSNIEVGALEELSANNNVVNLGLSNIYISIFNEPLELISPTVTTDGKSFKQILIFLKQLIIELRGYFINLETLINISALNRIQNMIFKYLTTQIDRLDIIINRI